MLVIPAPGNAEAGGSTVSGQHRLSQKQTNQQKPKLEKLGFSTLRKVFNATATGWIPEKKLGWAGFL